MSAIFHFFGTWNCQIRTESATVYIAVLDTINAWRYYSAVILSFACAETEQIFRAELSRRFPPDIQRNARRKLLALPAATELRHMTVPPREPARSVEGRSQGATQHSRQ